MKREWFVQQQAVLLRMANTRYGRELLAIDQALPEIVSLRPNGLTARLSGREYLSQFRTHNKYSKVILHRAAQVAEYAQYLRDVPPWQVESLTRQVPLLAYATVTTFFPNPDPESTSIDGEAVHNEANVDFTTLVAGAGTGNAHSSASLDINITAGTTTAKYTELRRGIFLFDTAALPDGDTIQSAVFGFHAVGTTNSLLGNASDNSRQVLVSSAPASNTIIASGDYDSVGATSFGEGPLGQDISTTAYNNITINASGLAVISKTGVTKLAARFKWDFLDVVTGLTWASGGVQGIRIRSADTADTDKDPKLEVTHAPPLRNQVVIIT